MRAVGIDIGAYSIKMAEVETSGKNVIIKNLTEQTLNPDPHADNQINILEILRAIATNYDPQNTSFVVAVSQDRVTLRHKMFPFRERSKISKSLPFELEDEIPFDSSTAIYDAKFIRHVGDNTDVLACACSKKSIEETLQTVHDAGIEPQIISMESAGHANTVEAWDQAIPQERPVSESEIENKPTPSEARLILDIGHLKTIVSVFRRDRLMATRTISWGGRNLIESIAKKYGVLYSEAIRETQAKAFILLSTEGATRDQIVFSDTLADSFSEMLKELKLTMMEIATDANIFFTNLEITGGTSRVKNLNAYFTQVLEIPCNYFDPFRNFAIGFEKTPALLTGATVALGLALEGLKRPKNPPVNFRKHEFGLQSVSWDIFWQRWSRAIQMGSVALVLFCVYAILKDQISLSLAERSEELLKNTAKTLINKRTVRVKDVEDFIKEKTRVLENQQKLAGLMTMNSAMDLVKRLSESLPQRTIDILHLNIDKQKMIIEGSVKDPKQINAIQNGLRNLSPRGKVNKINPSKARGSAGFAFELEVDRNIKGKEK